MKEITILGIDSAKNIFQLHGVDRNGNPMLRKTVTRGKLLETLANLPPCLVGMEACGGAHHWPGEPIGGNVFAGSRRCPGGPFRKSGKDGVSARAAS